MELYGPTTVLNDQINKFNEKQANELQDPKSKRLIKYKPRYVLFIHLCFLCSLLSLEFW